MWTRHPQLVFSSPDPKRPPPVVDPVRERDGERELHARRVTRRPAAGAFVSRSHWSAQALELVPESYEALTVTQWLKREYGLPLLQMSPSMRLTCASSRPKLTAVLDELAHEDPCCPDPATRMDSLTISLSLTSTRRTESPTRLCPYVSACSAINSWYALQHSGDLINSVQAEVWCLWAPIERICVAAAV